MKKLLKILFLLVIFALSAVLSLGMLFAGPSEAGANERLANKPVLIQRDGTVNANYLADWVAFINDRFFLRQELISANNKLNRHLRCHRHGGCAPGQRGLALLRYNPGRLHRAKPNDPEGTVRGGQ